MSPSLNCVNYHNLNLSLLPSLFLQKIIWISHNKKNNRHKNKKIKLKKHRTCKKRLNRPEGIRFASLFTKRIFQGRENKLKEECKKRLNRPEGFPFSSLFTKRLIFSRMKILNLKSNLKRGAPFKRSNF